MSNVSVPCGANVSGGQIINAVSHVNRSQISDMTPIGSISLIRAIPPCEVDSINIRQSYTPIYPDLRIDEDSEDAVSAVDPRCLEYKAIH